VCPAVTFPSKQRNLRITAWNGNSVTLKKQELECFLYTNKIDIAAINENKLLPKNRFSIPGYSVYRLDRNKFGGGVMLITNNNIRHDHFALPNMDRLEAIAVCIYLHNNKQPLFVSTYLAPAAPVVRTDLDKIFSAFTSVVLIGDLNSKHVAWNCSTVDSNGKTLLTYYIDINLSIHYPDRPTHFPHNSTPSVLDIALTKLCSVSKPLAAPVLSSNHNPIVFKLHLLPILSTPRMMYDYKHANW
jgi:hypothetical protein